MYATLTSAQINSVAKDAVDTLRRVGVKCSFVGGMACQLYGNTRKPNDLDIFVLSSAWTQEQLKRQVVNLNPRFYLIDARDPRATYKVLWYRISDTSSTYSSLSSYSHKYTVKIKVDLLLPGVMDIPLFPSSKITQINGLPAAPLVLVLLLKLQAWSQHRASIESRFVAKQYTDHSDIKTLLPIAIRRGVIVLPQRDRYLSQDMIRNAESRVAEHVRAYPNCRNDWSRLGFTLPRAPAQPVRRQYIPRTNASSSFYSYRDSPRYTWDSD